MQTTLNQPTHAARRAAAQALSAATIIDGGDGDWATIRDAWIAAKAARDAFNEGDEQGSWEAADRRATPMWNALRAARPTNAAAMVEKLRLIAEEEHNVPEEGGSFDDPVWFADFMARDDDNRFFGRVYQDALGLTGEASAIMAVTPQSFDAGGWLDRTEAATGSRAGFSLETGVTFSGGDEAAAQAAFKALPAWASDCVRWTAEERAAERESPPAADREQGPCWRLATGPAAMLDTISVMLANVTQCATRDGYEKARIAVRELAGLPTRALPSFEPVAFIQRVRAQGLKLGTDSFRNPQLYVPTERLTQKGQAVVNAFYRLTLAQRDALVAALASRELARLFIQHISGLEGVSLGVAEGKLGIGEWEGVGSPESRAASRAVAARLIGQLDDAQRQAVIDELATAHDGDREREAA